VKTGVGSVSLDAPLDRVFDYFSSPRNLVMANNRGPVVDRSEPPTGAGSWAELKFDQLRLRVEYEVWERPLRLAGVLRYTGLGSANRIDRFSYELEAAGDRTLLRYQLVGGPTLTLPLIGDWLDRRYWLNVERRVRAGTSDIRER
jgi:hypothetical protein